MSSTTQDKAELAALKTQLAAVPHTMTPAERQVAEDRAAVLTKKIADCEK